MTSYGAVSRLPLAVLAAIPASGVRAAGVATGGASGIAGGVR